MRGRRVAGPIDMTRGRGAGGPHGSRESVLVAPGDDLGDSKELEPGHGVIVVDGRLKAVKQGRMTKEGKNVGIQPRRTAYVPRPSDLVIGFVEGMTNNIWFIDIGAPFNAILPLSLGPSKASFGGLRSVLDVGDAILCRIQEVEENHSSVATMKGMGLRKLKTGSVESVDPHLLGRVIGSKGANLSELKEKTDTRIIVADNARVWIDGDVEGIISARAELSAMMTKAKISEYRGDV